MLTTEEREALNAYHAKKASDARRAFRAYNATPGGGRITDDLDTDAATAISDLIGDLLHLARQCEADPAAVIDSARRHFDAEIEPDDIALSSALDEARR